MNRYPVASESTSFQLIPREVLVDGYQFNVRSHYSANEHTVVLIHGIGVSQKYLLPLAEVLAKSFTVICIDMPGYGETKKPNPPLSLRQLTDLTLRLLKQEDIQKPVLIGQSMGCQIAARIGARQPGYIQKMILISPTINRQERSSIMQAYRLFQDTLREPWSLNLIIITDYLKYGPLRYMKTQKDMIADRIENYLRKCTQPTLIIRGTRDKIVPHDWAIFLSELTHNMQLLEVEDGPHNLQFTHTNTVANLCQEYIEK